MKKGFAVSYDESKSTVVVSVSGLVSLEMVQQWSIEGRTQAVEQGCGMLVDLRFAEVPDSYGDAYYHPRDTAVYTPLLRNVASAILLPPVYDHEFWEFYLTSANNAHLLTALFTTEDDAVCWLDEQRA